MISDKSVNFRCAKKAIKNEVCSIWEKSINIYNGDFLL